MQQYKTNLNSAHLLKDPGNMLLIRSDLHKSFDDRSFVFFPKGPQGSLVLHTLQQIDDLSQIFHNVQLHPIHCCPESLLARFAWSIFPFLTGFLCRHVPRYVVTVDEETGERAAREVFDSKHLQDRAVRSRSKSLKKRERAPKPSNDELADNDGLASCDASTSSQSKHSTDENQSPKRQKRNSHNLSEVPTKNGFEWYPGSTRFDMLREQALALQRPSNFHNEQKKRKMSLREELEDMGFEILDDFDQNNDNENGGI
jgi:HNH endonuclease